MANFLGTPLGNTPEADLSAEERSEISSNPWVEFLRQEFKTPFLSLIKRYLDSTNGKRQKTSESCLADFRAKYPKRFKLIFCLDALVHMVFLIFVLIFVVRGLGMEHEVKGVADYLLSVFNAS